MPPNLGDFVLKLEFLFLEITLDHIFLNLSPKKSCFQDGCGLTILFIIGENGIALKIYFIFVYASSFCLWHS